MRMPYEANVVSGPTAVRLVNNPYRYGDYEIE